MDLDALCILRVLALSASVKNSHEVVSEPALHQPYRQTVVYSKRENRKSFTLALW